MTEKWLNVEGLKFNCVNTKSGCQETHAENALEDHESECIYRLVPCPTLAFGEHCEEKVTFQDVIQHYEKHCGSQLKEMDESKSHFVMLEYVGICWNNLVGAWKDNDMSGDGHSDPYKIILKNRTFLFAGKTSEGIIYFWVYLLGSRNEAKHFSYTLKLFNNKSEISFKGKVAAIDECFGNVLTNGNCFAIPQNVYIAHFHEDHECSLEIQNMKEEVKDDNYESGISDNEEESKE